LIFMSIFYAQGCTLQVNPEDLGLP
jgi:hypothetical protein